MHTQPRSRHAFHAIHSRFAMASVPSSIHTIPHYSAPCRWRDYRPHSTSTHHSSALAFALPFARVALRSTCLLCTRARGLVSLYATRRNDTRKIFERRVQKLSYYYYCRANKPGVRDNWHRYYLLDTPGLIVAFQAIAWSAIIKGSIIAPLFAFTFE